MKIYEIDAAIEALVDENGEITDFEEFERLVMERGKKIENCALAYKNYIAESKALKEEADALLKRAKTCENKAESFKNFCGYVLRGEKFETPKVQIRYRASSSVSIEDDAKFVDWAEANNEDLLTYKVSINKTAVKEALKNGEDIPGASILEKQNIQIK